MPDDPTALVRQRIDDDLPACEQLARVVHVTDGYPMFLHDDDVRGFLVAPHAVGAWVADDAEIIGHVALHTTTTAPAIALATETLGIDAGALGIVARLMVAPTARRRGIAGALLDVATQEARNRGLVAILDVVTHYESAVALYERAGWRRLGTVDFRFPNGITIAEYVYRAPSEAERSHEVPARGSTSPRFDHP